MSSPPVAYWWLRSLLWSALGVVCGPVALSALQLPLVLLNIGIGLRAALAQGLAAFVMMSFFGVVIALAFGAAYLPILLAWGRWGGRVARVERSRRRLGVALALLAAPPAVVTVVRYAMMQPPFGARGTELAAIGAAVYLGTWFGLLLPRLIVPALRPGVFAPATHS